MPRFLKGTVDHDSDGRMGGSLKENVMTKERDAAETAAFEQGRHARAVAIPRDSSPHDKAGKLRKHWLAGWDHEDALRVPAQNDNANDPKKAGSASVGQAKTVSKPVKAKK